MGWIIFWIVDITILVLCTRSIIRHRREKKEEENAPVTWNIVKENYLLDTEHAKEFFDYYKEELEENDDYHLPAKDLKEDFEGEKVWKYEPLKLPFRIEEREVYSQLDGEWVRVGRLKREADLDGDLTLYFYVNEYKYVTEDSIDKEKGDHYFGIECRRTKTVEKSPSR